MLADIPESLRVFIPLAQSHSPLCSFAAGINPSQIFRLCVNKHFKQPLNYPQIYEFFPYYAPSPS